MEDIQGYVDSKPWEDLIVHQQEREKNRCQLFEDILKGYKSNGILIGKSSAKIKFNTNCSEKEMDSEYEGFLYSPIDCDETKLCDHVAFYSFVDYKEVE